jgi:hypothetical protein
VYTVREIGVMIEVCDVIVVCVSCLAATAEPTNAVSAAIAHEHVTRRPLAAVVDMVFLDREGDRATWIPPSRRPDHDRAQMKNSSSAQAKS